MGFLNGGQAFVIDAQGNFVFPDEPGNLDHVRGKLPGELDEFSGQGIEVIPQPLGFEPLQLDLADKRRGLFDHVKIRVQLPGDAFNGAQGLHHQKNIRRNPEPVAGNQIEKILDKGVDI